MAGSQSSMAQDHPIFTVISIWRVSDYSLYHESIESTLFFQLLLPSFLHTFFLFISLLTFFLSLYPSQQRKNRKSLQKKDLEGIRVDIPVSETLLYTSLGCPLRCLQFRWAKLNYSIGEIKQHKILGGICKDWIISRMLAWPQRR